MVRTLFAVFRWLKAAAKLHSLLTFQECTPQHSKHLLHKNRYYTDL